MTSKNSFFENSMPPENTRYKNYFSSSFSILYNLTKNLFENFDFPFFLWIKSEISHFDPLTWNQDFWTFLVTIRVASW